MESAAEFCRVLELPVDRADDRSKSEAAAQEYLQQAKGYLGSYGIAVKYETAQGYPEQKNNTNI